MKLKRTLNYLFVCAMVATLLTGCAKDGATGPSGANGANGATGPTGPISTGNLFGFVKKFDQYGSIITTNLNGISVTLSGSTNMTATTDSTGKYSFNNLTTGYYSLAYSDSLFGSELVSNQQFLGGSTVPRADVHISRIPNFNVTALTYLDTVLNLTDSVVQVTVTTSMSNPIQTSAILYVGSSASTSSSPATFLSFYTKNIGATATLIKIYIPLSDLYDLGFAPGQTVYFASYGIASNFANSSSYEDFVTGKSVFTAISTVPLMSSHIIP